MKNVLLPLAVVILLVMYSMPTKKKKESYCPSCMM